MVPLHTSSQAPWRNELLIEHLADPDPRVRETARASLVRMTGGDAAPGATGESAQEQWRAFARDRGWIR